MNKTKLNIKLIAYTPNAEELVACAGKLCYSKVGVDEIAKKQSPEDVDRFVNMLAGMEHYSPLEHACYTFAVEGVSRALTHQLVRHRLASYSQQSQRYVDLKDNFEYITPVEIDHYPHIKNRFDRLMNVIFEEYVAISQELLFEYCKEWVEKNDETWQLAFNGGVIEYMEKNHKRVYNKLIKRAIENARYVLPNACETKIVFTMNARTLLHFLEKRECRRAQTEIMQMAEEMRKILIEVSPSLFKYSGAGCRKGKCPEGNFCCGQPKEKVK